MYMMYSCLQSNKSCGRENIRQDYMYVQKYSSLKVKTLIERKINQFAYNIALEAFFFLTIDLWNFYW